MINILSIFICLFLFIGCDSESNQNVNDRISDTLQISKDSINLSGQHYCKINRIFERNSETVIEIDFLEFLSGDSAIIAAREIGEVHFEIVDSGDTLWYVPNDYFVFIKGIKSLAVPLSESCKIEITVSDKSSIYELIQLNEIDVSRFKAHYESYMIFVIEVKDGMVISIKEQWVP
ncbi:MAG: hypothetical protein KGZ85_13570 [Ignavibacterium sp.]|nr:hypothetical protein [Ignavibacterium sp.]